MNYINANRYKELCKLILLLFSVSFFNSCYSQKIIGNDKGEMTTGSKYILNSDNTYTLIDSNAQVRKGIWEEYYPSGEIKSRGEYYPILIQKIDTIVEVYQEFGVEGFKFNRYSIYPKNGLWKYYSKDGKLISEILYDRGQLIEESIYTDVKEVEPERINYPNYFILEYTRLNGTFYKAYYERIGKISMKNAKDDFLLRKVEYDKGGKVLSITYYKDGVPFELINP